MTITATERPDYLSEVLDSWEDVRDVQKYPFIFQVEPIRTDIPAMCDTFDAGKNLKVYVNPKRFGALSNPWHAMSNGFLEGADFVVLGEDDSVVSPDVMDFFSWSAKEYKGDKDIFAICSFNHKTNGKVDEVYRKPYFASVVWGMWKDRWDDEVKGEWNHHYLNMGWDWDFVNRLMNGRSCIFPCVSRSQHIGKLGGTHMPPDQFEDLQADKYVQNKTARVSAFKEVRE